jgi:hypothetical protein
VKATRAPVHPDERSKTNPLLEATKDERDMK